jgi:hypothetical protein
VTLKLIYIEMVSKKNPKKCNAMITTLEPIESQNTRRWPQGHRTIEIYGWRPMRKTW